MRKLIGLAALLALTAWEPYSGCARAAAPETPRPLALNERAVVIFEHSFQLIPADSAGTTTGTATPKKPDNQVTLKFILLITHNDNKDNVQSRLVIFQDKNPYPGAAAGTNKWFWSVYNQSLTLTLQNKLFLDFPALKPEFPEATEEPQLFDFPVGAAPVSPGDQVLTTFLFKATVPAQRSLAQDVEAIQVTPETKISDDIRTFLNNLGGRLATIPNPIVADPTPIKLDTFRFMEPKQIPTTLASADDEVSVSFPADFSKAPYNVKRSPFRYDAGSGKTYLRVPEDDLYRTSHQLSLYGYAADWITASYTANNSTPEAQGKKEFFASTPVHVLIRQEDGKQHFEFYPTYFTGKIKQATVNHDFAVVPKGASLDVDLVTLFPYLWSYLAPGSDHRSDPTTTSAAAPSGFAPPPAMAADFAISPSIATKQNPPLYHFPNPGLPTFNNDASGTSMATDLTLAPGDPENKAVPTLDVAGGKYFDHDFYNVSANASWKFTPFANVGTTSPGAEDPKDLVGTTSITKAPADLSTWTGSFGPQFSRTVAPNGNSSASKTSGMAAFSIEKDIADDSYKWTETSGISANSNNATGVSTDEYSGTTYAQQLWREYVPWGFADSSREVDTRGTPPDVVTMQIDLNEWVKPAEATQNSNFYTAGAGRFHVGADIPTPAFGGPAEFIRADTFLTGGGVLGVAPDTDRFYGGNSGGQGDAGTDVPTPVVRSFGTGKLGVFPTSRAAKQNPVGALSFANLNLTLAFPIPHVAVPFLNDDEARKLNHIFVRPDDQDPSVRDLDPGLSNRDEINYVANYDDWFSLKPVVTFDAAWLGGPPKYSDRSLVAVGGGAELSMAVLNLDVLYEVTLHDTAASKQPLGENIIVQLTYDIHF